ncbi:WbqC family protein [Pollutimonas thiosulfatoxidans]|uniref:WbqC family protein n=1 Tax=Pollutimonas thiosulfatoxidans TaxID=2028345 RepID=A0A410GEF8_9BURK|nr:WbqC family protein [Pollutimonas thiosulfatoxidans]QAA94687.1 hypothetical protein CKA81_13180 [Pollutimonas thiosulfatoxidans]
MKNKKIAILQSNYIPWKGYFDLIAAVDEFILYDDVQFTKNDWRNRNKIKTSQGSTWLTIPVGQNIKRRIRDVTIDDQSWLTKHWGTLERNYTKAHHFKEVSAWLKPLYTEQRYSHLSQLNRHFIETICWYLKIKTRIRNSWDYELSEGQTERLVDLCTQADGNEYISGPAAKAYIDESLFSSRNIRLTWFDYGRYPEYPQLWGTFVHEVSILDLLFNCGRDSSSYMRYTKA